MPDQKNNNNQKYNDLGTQIRDSVMQAVNSGDFNGLSESIGRSVATVLGDVGDSLNRAASQARGPLTEGQANFRSSMAKTQAEFIKAQAEARSNARREIYKTQAEARAQAQAQAERFRAEQEARIQRNKQLRAQNIKRPNIKYNEVGSVSAPFSVVGGVLVILLGAMVLAKGITIATAIFCAVAVILGGLLIAKGTNHQKWLKKASKIRALCMEKSYCTIDEIVSATGTNKKKTIKDIKKILSKGFFPEGYIDEECTTFMASKEVYNQYLQTKKQQQAQAAERLKEQGVNEEARANLSPEQQTELDAMMADGYESIRRLHELNEQIPGQSITEKLYITEGLLNDIFDRVKDEPAQMRNCRKLMDYHLPTVLKLVEAYAEYDKISVPGPEIIKAKDEIEKTLDLINQAFGELLNRLFQDSVWDVTSDAEVLKSMLTQEGLAKDIVVKEEV